MGIVDTTKEKSDELIHELIEKSDELILELKEKTDVFVQDTKEKSNLLISDVKAKSEELLSDEKFADMVVVAASKQESVNEVLKKRGVNYRLGAIEIGMGIPPLINFKIVTIADDKDKTD